jgi:hypothetical protein
VTTIVDRVGSQDTSLFAPIYCQAGDWDRRAFLALHQSVAEALGSFTYLEIGSYLGGSLQAVMQDPRCTRVLSIDPRPDAPPDSRSGTWEYADNSTEHMLALLDGLPDPDMSKITTFEVGTDGLDPAALSAHPDLCFVDGEHTDAAALRDGRFCAVALAAGGVIAFHDYELVKGGIHAFLREEWKRVTRLALFGGNASEDGGGVFAVELGERGLMRDNSIDRAIGSGWHSSLWRLMSRAPTPAPFFAAWSAVPRVDEAVAGVRQRVRPSVR